MKNNSKHQLIDPFHNIEYGDVSSEELTHFVGDKNMPIYVDCIGITNPNPDYFIERKNSDYYVFEYVLSGYGHITYKRSTITVGPDDMYILPEGEPHKYWADKRDPYKKMWINIKSSIIGEILKAYGLAEQVVFKNTNCKALFNELLQLANATVFNDEVCYVAAEIVFRIINRLAQNERHQRHVSNIAKYTRQYLEENLYGNITVENIAERLVVSKVQVINEFKKYYGVTPYAYYMNKKIDIAKQMLETTSARVGEIAEALGFCEQNYFSNLFKKKVGMSPDSYRKGTPPPENFVTATFKKALSVIGPSFFFVVYLFRHSTILFMNTGVNRFAYCAPVGCMSSSIQPVFKVCLLNRSATSIPHFA